jgi:V/A-type H+-transporting ATPase subunit I
VIEPMARAFVAARSDDREALLTALGTLRVLHLFPAAAGNDDEGRALAKTLARTRQALTILREVTPAGDAAAGTVEEIVTEVLSIQRRTQEVRGRLTTLHAEAREVSFWGSVTEGRLAELRRHGARVRVLLVADKDVPSLPPLFVPLQRLGNGRTVVVWLAGLEMNIPPHATILTPPERGVPDVERDIATLQRELDGFTRRLPRLAQRGPELAEAATAAEDRLHLRRALSTGLDGADLYGVQGWLPLARAVSLADDLAEAGIHAAVHVRPATPSDRPPTLVRYPRALRPIRALFDLLGVRPGYDEADPSAFFMVAVPLFAGMLISDAGYGLVFLLGALLAGRRLRPRVGSDAIHLFMLFGGAALAWGAISGSWFGVTPHQLQAMGGTAGVLGNALAGAQLIRGSEQAARDTLMKICFLLGSTHLILAHLRRVAALAPDTSALADLGWCGVLGAMLGVIWNLFFRDSPLPASVTRILLGGGGLGFLLVVIFSAPGPNALVRIGKGLGGGLFPLIGAFGDTLSYIRLAAVGLASFYLAVAIDTLAAQAAGAGTWLVGAPVLVVGHTLNMTLSLVAILAHGVRLNLLEFSSHSGLQWAGYPYRPFAARAAEEQG